MPHPSKKPTIHYCKRNGHSIAWTSIGSGPALVFSAMVNHAEQIEASPFWKLLEIAGHGRRLILYDGLGSGLSDRVPDVLTLSSCIADLEAVVDAAGLDDFALISGCIGAQVALMYAARHPSMVTRLVLVGGLARGLMHRNPSQKDLANREALLAALIARGDDFRLVPVLGLSVDAPIEELRALDNWVRATGNGEKWVEYFRAQSTTDVSDCARQVRCPTLIVHARRDTRIAFEEGRRLASLIPDAELLPVDSSYHWPSSHDPSFSVFSDAIGRFLSTSNENGAADKLTSELTPREREVLELIARGLDNMQIAAHLRLSEKTIRNHITPIFAKLAVESRSQAIVKAIDAGMGNEARLRRH